MVPSSLAVESHPSRLLPIFPRKSPAQPKHLVEVIQPAHWNQKVLARSRKATPAYNSRRNRPRTPAIFSDGNLAGEKPKHTWRRRKTASATKIPGIFFILLGLWYETLPAPQPKPRNAYTQASPTQTPITEPRPGKALLSPFTSAHQLEKQKK